MLNNQSLPFLFLTIERPFENIQDSTTKVEIERSWGGGGVSLII